MASSSTRAAQMLFFTTRLSPMSSFGTSSKGKKSRFRSNETLENAGNTDAQTLWFRSRCPLYADDRARGQRAAGPHFDEATRYAHTIMIDARRERETKSAHFAVGCCCYGTPKPTNNAFMFSTASICD
jgi:hypothetical protein